MKNKVFKLELTDYDETMYSSPKFGASSEPLFAFVTDPKDSKLKCKTDITYCRESICEYIRQDLRAVTNYGIILSKLHMVIYRRLDITDIAAAKFEGQVLAGQKMINIIEKRYGWPLTRIYEAVLINATKKERKANRFYYISANRRWIKSPIMLSLFTLLFRIATSESKYGFSQDINSFNDIFTVLGKLAQKEKRIELKYFKVHGHYWEAVLDHYNELFGQRPMADMYSPDANGYYFTEGINTLCDGDSLDTRLASDFAKIVSRPSQLKRIKERKRQSDPSTRANVEHGTGT